MPSFAYKAADSNGRLVTGTLEGPDERAVAGRLRERGYLPIRIWASGKRTAFLNVDLSRGLNALFQRVSSKDVMIFTQDLATLLGAGLPVDRSLSILIEASEKPAFREVVHDMLRTVQGGGYLSDALARHPRAFGRLYVNMVKAGEAGGVLEDVLVRLGEFLESAQDLKDYIRTAMVYPAFLVLVGGVSIVILLTFVIPKFSVIFADLGASMPLSTRILLGASEMVRQHWILLLAACTGALYGIRRFLRTPRGRLWKDQKVLGIPVAREIVRKMEVARFSRTLGTLIRSGVPILQALRLVKDVLGNQVISQKLEEVYARVKEGERLSRPLAESRIFPTLAIQMITVGEETGRMDGMLLRVADNYDKVVRNLVKRFIGFLEPAMILLMGLVVGFIVISMLMAIFSMNEMPF